MGRHKKHCGCDGCFAKLAQKLAQKLGKEGLADAMIARDEARSEHHD